jgi:cytochrome c oxidase subunit 1
MMGVMGAIYFWYPKMFGRHMSSWLGKLHFLLTFIFLNLTFLPMHFLGTRGFPRRYAAHNHIEEFADLMPINEFITYAAFGMGAAQLIFVVNFLGSLLLGTRADSNPWNANSLDWQTSSPPCHGNFEFQPMVERGPYEYSNPDHGEDYWPQATKD